MKFNGIVERPEPTYYLTLELNNTELKCLLSMVNTHVNYWLSTAFTEELRTELKKLKNA